MGSLPSDIVRVLRSFEDVFSARVWDWVTVLLVGAILAPGQRTVAAALRVMGLSTERQFQNYHRVLNRARWSSRELSRRLLLALVRAFVPAAAPVLVGLDDTIERRRGAKIAAKGIYRDPVRSSKGHFVKASGLRWVLLRDPRGRFAPQALLCTDPTALPSQIIGWFVARWQLEVTFHAVRAQLGVETQRQWSDLAIARTTPTLLGLFSLVTRFAAALLQGQALPVRQAAWYTKASPTFSDALALVRQHLWPVTVFCTSSGDTDVVEIPRALLDRLTDTLAFAA